VSKAPVIFISSGGDNMDIVMAMNMGGDDYIVKPFGLDVLTSKVQAMLRRAYDFGSDPIHLTEHMGLVFNAADLTAVYNGQTAELTKNESKILQTLLENKNRAVTREALMTKLWQTDSFIDENTLTVNVNRLRRKLDGLGLEGFIATKKGVGYIIQ
jgi:DNA-binding response OmpR family regulator